MNQSNQFNHSHKEEHHEHDHQYKFHRCLPRAPILPKLFHSPHPFHFSSVHCAHGNLTMERTNHATTAARRTDPRGYQTKIENPPRDNGVKCVLHVNPV